MKFGGGDDSNEPVRMEDVTPFHRELIEDWLEENKTTDDIKRELNNVGESDSKFWGEYREIYEPFATVDGSGGDAFLDTLADTPYAADDEDGPERPARPTEQRPAVFDLGDGTIHEPEQRVPPVRPAPTPTPQNAVPPTTVPRPGRGGRNEARKPSAVVRVARSIGRFFGIGRSKK